MAKWPLYKLADITSKVGSGATPRGGEAVYRDAGVPLIRSMNVHSTGFRDAGLVYIDAEEASKLDNVEVRKHDVLLNITGASIGRVTIAPEIMSGARVNQHVCIIRPTEQAYSRFIAHFFASPDQQARVMHVQVGATRQALTKGVILNWEIPLPTLEEQYTIVAEIEKQLTRLDAGIEALRRVQANLKRYRASILKAACEGRLVPTEAELSKKKRSTFESGKSLVARALHKRNQCWNGRGTYKAPMVPDKSKLWSLPEGWIWSTLDALAEVKGGIAKDQNRKHDAPVRFVPYLRVANVQRGYIDLSEVKEIATTEAEIQELSLKPNDILFNEGGDRDKLGRGWVWNGELPECIHQNHVFRARLFIENINPKLVSWYANTLGQKFFFDEGKHTTNLASISMSKLKQLPIPIAPYAEQVRIVQEVERRLSVLDELEATVSDNLKRARCLSQSILQNAFNGQLVAYKHVENASTKETKAKIAGPNRHFARALLSAEIVHRLYAEPTFGRIKHQKIFHLCEHIAQIEEIQGEYHREAAGPLDNKLIYANEAELKKQKWYKEVPRENFGHAYSPLEKAGGHLKYLQRYWADKLLVIERLIELMRKWDTDSCEIFSTTYAAWNDLLLEGKEPTQDLILNEILNHWHEKKRRISEKRWRDVVAWMSKEGFQPRAFGKLTLKAPN